MKNKQILPEAFYDSLSISNKLGDTLVDFRREEIHLFSYFSSILFLYKSNPIADWKYSFILDTKGYPFSDELDEVIRRHILNGILKENDNFLRITSKGTNEYIKFKEMPNISEREIYIKASCSTNIILPYSKTIRSLLNDPEITKMKKISSRQNLEIDNVYQQFHELSQKIGVCTDDLLIPAVTWINYIASKEKIG
jgi:hypothetical protein